MSTALLVVDVQRALVEGEHAVDGADEFVARLHALLERARTAGAVVVHLQDDGTAPGSLIPRGSRGWELVLPVSPGEPVVQKAEDDGFAGTELDELLRGAGVDRLVIVGIQSEMCVAATARGALARGYEVVVPRDGHTTYDVPADPDGGVAVPAAHVSRVAEWSLGDGVDVPRSVDDVVFDAS